MQGKRVYAASGQSSGPRPEWENSIVDTEVHFLAFDTKPVKMDLVFKPHGPKDKRAAELNRSQMESGPDLGDPLESIR